MSLNSPIACAWKIIHGRHHTPEDCIIDVIKTKASRSENEVSPDPVDRHRFQGNKVADSLAKLGAELHALSEEHLKLYQSMKSGLKKLAGYMVEVLSDQVFLRQERFGRVPRVPEQVVVEAGPARNKHMFLWIGRFWIVPSVF